MFADPYFQLFYENKDGAAQWPFFSLMEQKIDFVYLVMEMIVVKYMEQTMDHSNNFKRIVQWH